MAEYTFRTAPAEVLPTGVEALNFNLAYTLDGVVFPEIVHFVAFSVLSLRDFQEHKLSGSTYDGVLVRDNLLISASQGKFPGTL